MKGVPFVNGSYMKGVTFLSKMVFKRVKGASPYKTLLSVPRETYLYVQKEFLHYYKKLNLNSLKVSQKSFGIAYELASHIVRQD